MSWALTTDAAAKYFGRQVGDEVDESDVLNAEGRNKPVTMGRLRSLQRQFREAKVAGNKELQGAVNSQFGREFTIYMEVTGESAHNVLNALEAAGAVDDSESEIILGNAQEPREPEVTPEQLDRNLAALEESFQVTESVEPTTMGAIDMVRTLDAAGLQAPPMGEFDIAAISRFGDWSWGTRHLSEESLYMFDVEKVMTESFNREPFFALCHAGHGANSYGLNLVTSKGPVVVLVQHGWRGAYNDPEKQKDRINATYGRIRRLFDRIEDPTEETRWGLVYSDFRGVCGAVDLQKFFITESFEESLTEVFKDDESREPDEDQLFAFVLGELYE